jgi:hypothetical protein
MEFRIADTFTDALAKLMSQEQKAAKTTAFDLQMDPSGPGLQFHRIDQSKDPNFWSIRVNRDLRIIIHKTASSFLLAYVGHHNKAYDWAVRRRIEAHPKTGAIQIVEVRERVEEIAPPTVGGPPVEPKIETVPPAVPPLFEALTPNDLLTIGVPSDWVQDVRQASEDRFFEIASHLPAESAEALLEYAATGVLHRPAPPPVHVDPFAHPDALRRFRVIENVDELQRALAYPWEKWAVFLHPSQRSIVEQSLSGPARVAGSAGTGTPSSSAPGTKQPRCPRAAHDVFASSCECTGKKIENPDRGRVIGDPADSCYSVRRRRRGAFPACLWTATTRCPGGIGAYRAC